jgi:hypothetical protein
LSNLLVGTYVTHAKMPELGSGEVTASDGERLAIRFASGEKNFVLRLVEKHLTVTAEAPAEAKPSRTSRTPRASKPAKKKSA